VKAATAVARLSHRNSIHPSVCHMGGQSKMMKARITKSLPSDARKRACS